MKQPRNMILFLIFISLFASGAHGQLDAASQEALEKTNKLLKTQSEREAFIKTDSKAQSADSLAKKVGGSAENTQSIYELSSQVFEKLVQKYNGDPEKLKAVIERAQKDPAGFANSEFSAEELKALRELSGKIPTTNTPAK